MPIQGALRQMRIAVCQSSLFSQPKRALPLRSGCQQAAFAGQIAGVPGGVAAESGQRVVNVVNDQGQGAERESQHGNGHPAQREDTNNLFWKDDDQGQPDAT